MTSPFVSQIETIISNSPSTSNKFCIEGFMLLISTGRGAGDDAFWMIRDVAGSTVTVRVGNVSLTGRLSSLANGDVTVGPYTVTIFDDWMHVAFTYDGITARLFVEGIQVASLITTFVFLTAVNYAAMSPNDNSASPGIGRFDECRCIIGAPVYVANFTPPSVPFVL